MLKIKINQWNRARASCFFMDLWSKCGVVRAGWLCKNDINIWVWLWGVVGAVVYLVAQLWKNVGVRRPSSAAGHINDGNFASHGAIFMAKL